MPRGGLPLRGANGAHKPRSFDFDWIWRPLFGLLLAGAALATLIAGGIWFAGFIVAGTAAGAREWHRMVRRGSYLHYVAVSALAIAAAVALPLLTHAIPSGPAPFGLALAVLAGGALVNLAFAATGGAMAPWQAAGPLYLGVPALALFALRAVPGHGIGLVLVLFAAVWATDSGAFASGKLIGGPKLAPVLSPNKTWAGFFGGVAAAAAAAAIAMALLHGSAGRGAIAGAVLALASHAGDLFESWVKRRVGRKDSGHLIPGHGGVLDRIDSILFAAPAFAAFVFLFGAQAIFGGQP